MSDGRRGSLAIQSDPTDVDRGIVAFNPICKKPGEPALVAQAVRALLHYAAGLDQDRLGLNQAEA